MFTSIRTMLLFALIPVAALAYDVSGKWTFQVETGAGSGSPTFVFKQGGEQLTGTTAALSGPRS
jgi:hypothetical protein